MAQLKLSAKDEARLAKEKARRVKDKAAMQKSLAVEAKKRNKWRVNEAFRRAAEQERERTQRQRAWKAYAEDEKAKRLKAYRDYLKAAGSADRGRWARLSRPRLVLREAPLGGGGFALRVGSFASIVSFLATVAAGLSAELSLESLIFFSVAVALVVFLAALALGWWMREDLARLVGSQGGGALGRLVDRIVDGGPEAGAGGGS